MVIALLVMGVAWVAWSEWDTRRDQAQDERDQQIADEAAVLDAKRQIWQQIDVLAAQSDTEIICSDARGWSLQALQQIQYDSSLLTVGDAADAAYGYTYGAYCEASPDLYP